MMENIKKYPTDLYEISYREQNLLVAGVDEVGRGCIAGPVVAAAVILPVIDFSNIGLNDSKLLSSKKRNELYSIIIESSISYGIGIIDNKRIDEINILRATLEAMKIAVEKLNPKPQHLLVDGNYFKFFGIPFTTIIRGDKLSNSIAAASILAKVTRDTLIMDLGNTIYPEYDFCNNKGYGTKNHYLAIEKFGITQIHRNSFLKKFKNKCINRFL